MMMMLIVIIIALGRLIAIKFVKRLPEEPAPRAAWLRQWQGQGGSCSEPERSQRKGGSGSRGLRRDTIDCSLTIARRAARC